MTLDRIPHSTITLISNALRDYIDDAGKMVGNVRHFSEITDHSSDHATWYLATHVQLLDLAEDFESGRARSFSPMFQVVMADILEDVAETVEDVNSQREWIRHFASNLRSNLLVKLTH